MSEVEPASCVAEPAGEGREPAKRSAATTAASDEGTEPEMNRLLQQLRTQHAELSAEYDEVLNRCADENRDPSEAESGILEGLRTQLEPLGERIVELRSVDDRRHATITALDDYPELPGSSTGSGNGPAPIVQIRSEELVYRRDGGPDGSLSFFRDLMFRSEGDPDATDRINRHTMQVRALGTTVTGAGAVPPVWLPSEFAELARGSRPVADTLRRVPITSATPVTVGVQTAGANVGTQVAEGDPATDGDFGATPLVTTPKTKTGKIDVTRQLVDGSNPAVDTILYGDLMGAYNEQVELEVLAALAAQAGIAGTIPVDTVGDPDNGVAPDLIVDGISRAATAVRSTRKRAPSHVYLTHVAFGALSREKDGAGRPLITTGRYGPQNAVGLAESTQYEGVAGDVLGFLIVPSWAGADGAIYVVRASDLLLLESATLTFRFEEVVGPEKIRLGVWGYVGATTGRYPKAIARVNIIPAPSGFGGEPPSSDEPNGNGGGNGDTTPASKRSTGAGK